ncbi:MAG TPA: Uma2 family endonuclease [Thiothrix sp.]|nr:Uma2 family endonuclease [Thiothrix sp.]
MIKTSATSYRYPDIVVVCDNDPSAQDTIRESPLLIIEILSKSTRKKDKGEKRKEYLSLPSLQEYVLIEQDFAEIEVQRKSENWRPCFYTLGDTVVLQSVDAAFAVKDIYQRVDNEDMRVFLQQKTASDTEVP